MNRTDFEQWTAEQLRRLQPGQKLPSDREISKRLGLSERVIRSVLKEYAARGLLERRRGSGTFIPKKREGGLPPIQGRSTASEDIAAQIHGLIARGELERGSPLPPIKVTCINYHVTPATVIGAYRLLAARRIVTKIGKKYFVGAFALPSRSKSPKNVIFFDLGETGFDKIMSRAGMFPAYVKMERELVNYGYTLRYASREYFSELLMAHGNPAGIGGLVTGWMNRSELTENLSDIVKLGRRLPSPRPPVLLFSEAPSCSLPEETLLLCRGNFLTVWARTLAAYLSARGRTEIAIFSDFARKGAWSLNTSFKLIPELLRLNRDTRFTLIVKYPNGTRHPHLFLESIWHAERRRTMEKVLNKYDNIPLGDIERSIRIVGNNEEVFDKLDDYTTWLFDHDGDAVDALQHCRRRGIDVPHRRMLIGFENDPAYLRHGLSTCVVDSDRIGYLMAHALIGDIPVARTTKGYLRPAAMILERHTTS
jgi:DNA-binding transcriptional regulator YhcF (GntR family)